jgi:hypothetical protein
MAEVRHLLRAPRFDASGKKTANARFESIRLNGQLIQQNVEMKGNTPGGPDWKKRLPVRSLFQGDPRRSCLPQHQDYSPEVGTREFGLPSGPCAAIRSRLQLRQNYFSTGFASEHFGEGLLQLLGNPWRMWARLGRPQHPRR